MYGKELAARRPGKGAAGEAAGAGSLGASVRELHEKQERRKKEIRGLLDETEALMKRAVAFLKKANRLTRCVTARQRQGAGVFYPPSFFDTRLKGRDLLPLVPNTILNPDETPAELRGFENSPEYRLGELKALRLMDALKKNLLALDLLEMRCQELLLSIDKAMAAFKHEYALVRRRLYPRGIFSILRKHLRRLRGFPYFSGPDLKELSALGELTGQVLKIADSPIL